jgi:prolipoprotein diacylglyceryltransferase
VICLLLFLFWRRSQKANKANINKFLTSPGCTFAMMFILYGFTRFIIEFFRGDNPFEIEGIPLTISQYLGMAITVVGLIQLVGYTAYNRRKQLVQS